MSEENKQYTFENEQYRKTYWHTCSHVLAQAVKRLWPSTKLAIGPAIENGFYYDLDSEETFTPEDLSKIEMCIRDSSGRGKKTGDYSAADAVFYQ